METPGSTKEDMKTRVHNACQSVNATILAGVRYEKKNTYLQINMIAIFNI